MCIRDRGTGVSVNQNTGAITVSIGQSVATSASPTFDQVITGNNGNGTNFRIGDDAWIGDINVANTFRVQGVQDATQGYIVFGNSNATALGRTGTGALTYGGNTIYHAGNSNTITSLGTIATGVWNGTAIGDSYISSAATWNAKQAALNGTGFVKISGTTISYDNSTYYLASNPSGYITSSSNISGSAGSLSDDSGYLRTRAGGAEASLDSYTDNGIRGVSFTGYSQHLLSWNVGGSPGTIQQLFHYDTPNNGWKIRNKTDNSSWSSWGYVVMASANQGKISGTIYHSGNLTNLNQLSNGPGYITSSSLASYVPYTGATANIDTGGYSITAGAVTLTSNLWLKNIGTYDFIMSNATSVTTNTIRAYYNTSDELRFYAKNTAGSAVVPKIMVGDGTTFYTLYHSGNLPTIPTNNNQLTNGAGYITSSSLTGYLPLSGGIMTGSIVNNTDGAVIIESNATENNNWLWKENAKAWGLFWFNRGTQSGQTIGGYTTIGAELMFMGESIGIAMPSGWTGYYSTSKIAAMISNYNGYIYSASTIYAATSMVVAGNTVLHAGNYNSYAVAGAGYSTNQNLNTSNNVTFSTINSNNGYSFVAQGYNNSGGFAMNNASTYWGLMWNYASNDWRLGYGSTTAQVGWNLRWDNGGTVWANASMRAPIFYDSDDTGYYVDPNAVSRLYRLQVIGDWAGASPNQGAINIRGQYPSMTFRNSVSGTMWLRHMDGSGNIQHYYASDGIDSANWSIKHTMYGNGDFYSAGNNTATYFYGSGSIRLGDMWGSTGGLYRPSGIMAFGTENEGWRFTMANDQKAYIGTDGNLWMKWAGDYISNLLGAKQNASTAINTSNIGSQSVTYATRANYLDPNYNGNVSYNPQSYFNNGVGVKVAMTGAWSVWSDTLWINGYTGGDVPSMCALHFLRNGTPRMAISTQTHGATSYGAYYEVITSYNIAGQSVSYASTAGSAPANGGTATAAAYLNGAGYIYRGGFSGNWNTDFQNTPSSTYRYYGDNAGDANSPGGSWWFSESFRHSNGSNYWGTQVAWGWEDNANRLATRNISANSFGGWVYYLNSSNFTSYIDAPNKAGTSYYQVNTWMQLNGVHGLYAPSYNGAHFYPNNASSYTTWAIQGSRSGYGGIYDGYSAVHGIMYDSSGNGGVYREANGRWYWYYHLGNACMGINTSTTSSSYAMYVNGNIYATGDITAYSDRRKKTNIVTIDKAIETVTKMRGVFYDKIGEESNGRQLGVIAQEVNEILPEAVNYASDIDEYGVKYGNMVGLLIEAVKEQQLQIEELKNKLDNVLSSR
jgi:hypothetical protein